MDPCERRELLRTRANPGGGRDYVITLSGTLKPDGMEAALDVVARYVPDRLIVEPADFETYLRTIQSLRWETLEAVAVAVIDDMSDRLVARWVQVTIRGGSQNGRHDIAIEDHQPGWHNEDLLYRLPPV